MKKFTIITIAFLTIVSCKNDDGAAAEQTFGNVVLDFKNTIDNVGVELTTTDTYTNGSNEVYSISELKYIISNIVLIKANGEEFKYPVERSYFVVNEEIVDSKKISLADINAGDYSKIKFGFGVDSSKYPIESGTANFIPTAEENGMLWNWAAGYKFLKFEGVYGDANTDFLIHVGSHGAGLDNYQEITLELPSALTIAEGTSPEVAINADIAKIFDSANTHSLAEKNSIQVDATFAPIIAENIGTMFSATKVSN